MYNITLLSSSHIQLGKCNSDELCKIIEEVQPEIIFEELPYDYFEIIYAEGYHPQSLEAIAVKKYLEKYHIKHIPVDSYQFSDNDVFDGFDRIAENSPEYINTFNEHLKSTSQFGYTFLNSNNYIESINKIHLLEEKILTEIDDPILIRRYKLDRELHDKRENEMLQNIYEFSKLNHYNKAMFICGAEHRKSIIQKIQEIERKSSFKLNWIYDY